MYLGMVIGYIHVQLERLFISFLPRMIRVAEGFV